LKFGQLNRIKTEIVFCLAYKKL